MKPDSCFSFRQRPVYDRLKAKAAFQSWGKLPPCIGRINGAVIKFDPSHGYLEGVTVMMIGSWLWSHMFTNDRRQVARLQEQRAASIAPMDCP